MSMDSYLWLKAGHLAGVVGWLGGMVALALILGAARDEAAAQTGRRAAMIMDLGATVAIVVGLALLFGIEPSPLKRPNFHIKLTLVVVGLLGLHGFLRVRLKRVRQGRATGLPGFVLPVMALVVVAILAAVYPLAIYMSGS